MRKQIIHFSVLTAALALLTGCSDFAGIRTPRYDGQPFEAQPEKIAAYAESREILGEEKANYIPETFSDDILNPSLEVIEHDPVLLEEGTYVIGEDLPAGRVTLIGEKLDPSHVFAEFETPGAPKSPDSYRVGTMTIRDAEGKLYFENMFHFMYGVLITQVDFIEGHTIKLTGSTPEVVVFYANELPDNPYVFDNRYEEYYGEMPEDSEVWEESGAEEESASDTEGIVIPASTQEQPIKVSEDGQVVELNAGIYEVGKHFEPGTYEITEESSPTYTELFIFSGDTEPRVIEMRENLFALTYGWGALNETDLSKERPIIELKAGDKIYPHYVAHLKLTKVAE